MTKWLNNIPYTSIAQARKEAISKGVKLVIGPPKATKALSSDDIAECGYIGIYEVRDLISLN